jgi:fatty-acyl-CoA synthase
MMMADQLRVAGILEHAAQWHPDTEVVSRLPEGGLHRYTYAGANRRSKQLANALLEAGANPGDRIGTLA